MKKLVLITLLFALCGCSRRIVDFTIISSKNIDLSRGASFTRGATRVTGVDKTSIIVIIPLGEPNLKTALDKAIESTKGCVALLDGVVYYKSFYIPYIYGQAKYIIEGTPLIDPKLSAMNNTHTPLPRYSVIKLDKNNSVIETKEITEQEFSAMKAKMVKNYPDVQSEEKPQSQNN